MNLSRTPLRSILPLLFAASLGAQERPLVPTDYYRMTFVGDVAVSPTAEFVAFTVTTVDEEENTRERRIWLAPVRNGEPAGEPFPFTDPTRDSSSPSWSPDGSLLAFQSRRGAEGSTWFARVGSPGGEAYRVPGVEAAPLWSPDGRWIAYVSAPDDGEAEPRAGWIAPDALTRTLDAERFDGRVITHIRYKSDGTHDLLPHPATSPRRQIHVVPASGGEPVQVTDVPFDVGDVSWSPDGRWLVFSGNEMEDEDVFAHVSHVYAVPRSGGEARRLTSGEGAWEAPAVSPDGRRMALLYSAGSSAPTDLVVVDVAADLSFAGEPENLTGDWDLDPGSPEWTPAGGLRFQTASAGNRHLFETSPEPGAAIRAVTEGERQLGSFSTSRDGRVMAYTSTDPVSPAEVFVASGDGEREHRITSFNDDWLTQVDLTPAERLTWRVDDGTEIEGWVIPPADYRPGQRYPLVLKAHGGPHSMYGNTFFQTFQVLSGAGFFVLYANPRGSSGYGHDFMTGSTTGYWGLVDEEDFLTGIDAALAKYPAIDPDRIGVGGGSYGGYVTNWLTSRSDRFAAAVTSRSIASLENLYGTTDSRSLEHHFLGPPWEQRDRYREASPISYVENVTAPTLIIHSERDHRTPMQDAEMWFMALARRGVPVEFVRYPRSSHGLSRSGEPWLLVDRLERLRSWFVHWLIEAPARATSDGAG